MIDNLNTIRQNIDEIDDQLLKLLNARATLSLRIADIKKQSDPELKNILDEQREQAILARLSQQNAGPLDNPTIERLFNLLFTESRALQAGKRT